VVDWMPTGASHGAGRFLIHMIDRSRLSSLPTRPGCYLFKGPAGELLYVGKAANIRNRVRSYFTSPDRQSVKVRAMMAAADDLQFIVTDSEVEALILELNLIKEHHPRYNVGMRDDKQFPYLCITLQEPFPRVVKVRRVKKDGAAYFGPYADTGALNETMSTLKKLFPYRSCDLVIPDDATHPEPVLERPCLEYFIKRCIAPCVRYASRVEYRAVVDQVLLFMQGKHDAVLHQLNEEMERSAREMRFERAAQIRDQIVSVERVIERQKITTTRGTDQDILAVAIDEPDACVQIFHVREGKVVAQNHFLLRAEQSEPAEVLESFIEQYYERAAHIPKEIILQHEINDVALFEEWLGRLRKARVTLTVPRIGERRRLIELVADNARQSLEQHKLKWLSDAHRTTGALVELQEALGLDEIPNRIECYDISNIQGTSAVGSMVVFERGRAKNSEYRRFKIKTVEGANDFAMLAEMLQRRFKRLDSDGTDESFGSMPDLIIIDGGKGQLGAACDTLSALGHGNIAVVSLAKRMEEIFVPGRSRSTLLPRTSQGLYLIQRIRDEAHRFAITYHRLVRQKGTVKSQIDSVPGIGPSRRKALLKTFGSVRGIKAASADEIAAVQGMSQKLAETVKLHLQV
jgi:excinuclease ABC subunit C